MVERGTDVCGGKVCVVERGTDVCVWGGGGVLMCVGERGYMNEFHPFID